MKQLKTPKGTRDYTHPETETRRGAIDKIVAVFRKHGAVEIETPVLELRDLLLDRYGDDTKLIYNLEDQQGELCSLRYDLTVPFARLLGMKNIQKIKRFQIGKVYRRDQPAMTKGRHREFYQCDFDIAGSHPEMAADAECLAALCSVLDALGVGRYTVVVGHRLVLDGVLEVCNVPAGKKKTVLSSIDKIEKQGWECVLDELTREKGIDRSVASAIRTVMETGTGLCSVKDNQVLMENETIKKGVAQMERLFSYVDAFGRLGSVVFDIKLARGLDYYTGLIFEAVLEDKSVGSIAGGGRYDELVGQLSGKGPVPCVGFSVGIERIFAMLKEEGTENNTVAVIGVGKEEETLGWAMRVAALLWRRNIGARLDLGRRFLDQIQRCEREDTRVAVIVGKKETAEKTVLVKSVKEKDDRGRPVPEAEIVVAVEALLRTA
ncbi:MAG: histidyl-tRNA synthetase [Amphiamblys sp. WSBS2006]|nr:MAG: histidyl-tRNA synthetase [Amphiamblys sp. WSBS2006]